MPKRKSKSELKLMQVERLRTIREYRKLGAITMFSMKVHRLAGDMIASLRVLANGDPAVNNLVVDSREKLSDIVREYHENREVPDDELKELKWVNKLEKKAEKEEEARKTLGIPTPKSKSCP